ncbi:hypothetical protein BKA57DRAFT_529116 [Linnemannia elongata]|nr:hypothetical protein BKA57DRAFT_529116 [Linnemannia elongata]
MRIPTIVLLSSVALSLLVNAETTPLAPAAAAVAPIAANVAAAPAAAAADTKPDDIEALSSLKMKEDGKTYPVGKGIVFTKTTFVVDDKNKDKNSATAIKDDDDDGEEKTAEFSVQGFLGNLLGIDINLGGDGKKKKDPPTDSTTPPAEETDPDYIPLYGDEGYKPRPVPKGCPELIFLDQMIWDQQGNNGLIEGPASITPPVSPAADASALSPSEAKVDKKDASEVEKKDAPAAEEKSKKEITTTEPKEKDNKDEKEKLITKIDTSAVTVIDPKDLSKDGKDPKKVDPKGIHICLLGGCDDDDDEDDDGKQRRRKIRHKQKKFLRQFRGKALKIDGRTGCPIPSKA